MDLSLLPTFIAFAETLNLTKTAQRVHLSQPAVHMHIKKLEEELGVALYHRVGRGLELTREGVALSRFARETGTRTRDFLTELRGEGASEPVVLAAGEGAYLYLLGPAIRSQRSRLTLLTRDRAGMLEAVRSGLAQLGVAALDASPEGLVSHRLTTVEPVLVLPRSHPLAKRRRIRLRDLTGARLIVPPEGRPHREAIAAALRQARVPWEIAVEANGWELMIHFAGLGMGLAIVNGCCRLPRGLCARPLEEDRLAGVEYRVVHTRSAISRPEVRALLDALRAHAEDWRTDPGAAWAKR
jgi:DNA-binding transcriptional LysR family regulator